MRIGATLKHYLLWSFGPMILLIVAAKIYSHSGISPQAFVCIATVVIVSGAMLVIEIGSTDSKSDATTTPPAHVIDAEKSWQHAAEKQANADRAPTTQNYVAANYSGFQMMVIAQSVKYEMSIIHVIHKGQKPRPKNDFQKLLQHPLKRF